MLKYLIKLKKFTDIRDHNDNIYVKATVFKIFRKKIVHIKQILHTQKQLNVPIDDCC